VAAAALVSPADLIVVVHKPKSEFEREMMHLEAEIRRLEAEFNMFFAGRLPRPPWETRARVAALVKKHDQSFIRNTADRFRFESLQSRHSKFLELWERQMTNKELGRPTLGVRKSAPSPAPPAPAAPPAKVKDKHKDDKHKDEQHKDEKHKDEKHKDEKPKEKAPPKGAPADPEIVRFARDEGAVDDRVKQLFEQLSDAKKQVGEKPIPIDRLTALVKAQVDKFGAEGKDVAFKVALKDGKVQLTAKPADEKPEK
jgi:hypothetical protein